VKQHVSDDPEIRRLRTVYANYGQDGPGGRWNARHLGNRLMLEERATATLGMLRHAGLWPLDRLDVLEIGCGAGGNLALLVSEGADPRRLHGVDVMPELVAAGREQLPSVDLRVADARTFSLGQRSVDLILVHTVFSSILDDAVIEAIVSNIRDMLRPNGAVLWYDFFLKNPRNPHTRAMTKAKIRCIFKDFRIELQRITLLPPLARNLGPLTRLLYPSLARLLFLDGHYLGLLFAPTGPTKGGQD
jgi:SAM-dependent methyltransferase